MALVFADGFDGYPSTTYMTRAGWANNGVVSASSGKFSTNALGLNLFNGGRGYATSPRFTINDNDFKTSFWARNADFGIEAATGSNIIYLAQVIDVNRMYGVRITLNSSTGYPQIGYMDSYFGNFIPKFNVNTGFAYSCGDSQWHHYEMRFVPSNTTTGLVQLWVDSQLLMDYQNVPTINTSNSIVNNANGKSLTNIILSWPGTGGLYGDYYMRWDDVIVWDNSGSEMNTATKLGPHRIRSLWPVANGTYKQWNGYANTGGNYSAVATIDDDSGFAEANNAQLKDSYYVTTIPANPTKIPAITVRTHQRNADIGDKQFSIFLKSGAIEVNSNSYIMNTTLTYTYAPNTINPIIYHANPNGNIAWTSSSLANVEIGMKVEN